METVNIGFGDIVKRRTRAVIVLDSGHVVLSALQPETIAGRMTTKEAAE